MTPPQAGPAQPGAGPVPPGAGTAQPDIRPPRERSSREGPARRSLRASAADGAAWAVMFGFVEAYVVPFAVALKAGTMEVGLLRSLAPLLSSAAQLKTPDLARSSGGRRRLLSSVVLLQAAAVALAGLCAFLPAGPGLALFIVFAAAYTVLGSMAGPPWASLMGEYLPPSRRGSYFGWRTRLVGLAAAGFGLLAGLVLAAFGKGTLAGFALLFSAAAAARLVSRRFIMRMVEPRFRPPEGERFPFTGFVARMGKGNFATFTLCCAAFLFGAHVSAPFFAVFMLQDLGFTYLQYTAVVTAGTVSMYYWMSFWGRRADAIGGARTVKIAVLLIPAIPLLWCLSRDYRALAAVELFSGFCWAAYYMGVNNFLYDASSPAKRTRALAYFGAFTGLAQASAPLLGGWLYPRLPAFGGHTFISLLLLSAGLRLAAGLFLAARVREAAAAPDAGPRGLLYSFLPFRHAARP